MGILEACRGHRPHRRSRSARRFRTYTVAAGAERSPWRAALGPRSRRPRRRMTFDEARALFPVLERVAYLNAGTFGPLAQPTADAIAAQVREDLLRGRSGKRYIDAAQAARSALRGLIA